MERAAAPRLLLADDEETLLESLSRAAAARGYLVDAARDGEHAWSLLAAGRYDVVVTDLKMPRMDGPELLGKISVAGLSCRVVVITGYATLEAAVDCLRKGAVDFLVKPFEVEAFLGSVDKALLRSPAAGAEGPDWAAVARRFRLSRRQKEILKAFYGTGKTNRELAEELCLSPHTVKSHLKAAFAKLRVTSRAQLLQSLRELV